MGVERTPEDIRAAISAATVKVIGYPADLEKVGMGVLAGNGYLVTAAHCLEFDNDTGARITIGEHVFYEIETAQGEHLKAAPVFIESISDIAVLGPLDPDAYPGEWVEAYESFCARTRPAPLWRMGPASAPASTEFQVHIYTHEKSWISGKARVRQAGRPNLWIRADRNIEGGTSGGPIVNDSGELVSVVSAAGGYLDITKEGHPPLLKWALPAWIYRAICGFPRRR
ncbi:MAG: Trypsin-like peptidase domain [Deltaproteobacteria bacterium]|nr:Trypsin-like peptidase domain [Deltaproteobacteria bacterium]